MKSVQSELEQMLKVDSPAPKAEKMPNWPTRKENARARSSSRKRDAHRLHVGRLLPHLEHFHQVGLVDVGSCLAWFRLGYLVDRLCSTGSTPRPTGQLRVQLPQPVQRSSPNFSG